MNPMNRTGRYVLPALMFLLVLFATTTVSAEPSAQNGNASPVVSIGFRPLVLLHATVFGMAPEARAQTARQRIDDILNRGIYGPVTTASRMEGESIFIGGEFVLLITPDDLDKVAGETLDGVVTRARSELEQHLANLARMKDPAFVISAVTKTVLSLLALIAYSFLLLWVSRRVQIMLNRVQERMLGHIQIAGLRILDHLLVLTHSMLRLLYWIGLIVPAYLWLAYSLEQFPATQWWGEQLTSMALHMVKGFGVAVLKSLPDLLMVALIIVLTQIMVRLVKSFFSNVKEGRSEISWVDAETAAPLEKIFLLALWLMALVICYPYLPGSSSDAFKGISIMAGLVVSFGSASAFSQILAGLTLMFSKTFKPGDYVQINETEGVVLSLGYLSTKIRTGRNEEISIPNTLLLTTSTKNYSKEQRAIGVPISTQVSIGYGDPWRTVHRLLLDAAEQTPGLKPEAKVFQLELGDFYIVYELLAYLDGPQKRREVLSQLHQNIQDAFNAAGVQIMSPHYEGDPAGKVWVPRAKWGDAAGPIDAQGPK